MQRLSKLFGLLCLIFAVAGCNYDKEVKPDNPSNAAWLMKVSIDRNNYDQFLSFFSEQGKKQINKDKFHQLQKVTTPAFHSETYQLLTFENGEMILVQIESGRDGDLVQIQDVELVPEELNHYFRNH